MYPWVSLTCSPLCGECEHKCYGPNGKYCYVEGFKKRLPAHMKKYTGKYRIEENELKQNFYKHGEGLTMFVENMGDLFAKNVPFDMITAVLEHCCKYPKNTYLFQSKNPERFIDFWGLYPPKVIFGTTLEADVYPEGCGSEAPPMKERASWMMRIPGERMISVEPVMDFSVKRLLSMIILVAPAFVSIGADSKKKNLPEPSAEKVEVLIAGLEKAGIVVKRKKNLKRLTEG